MWVHYLSAPLGHKTKTTLASICDREMMLCVCVRIEIHSTRTSYNEIIKIVMQDSLVQLNIPLIGQQN